MVTGVVQNGDRMAHAVINPEQIQRHRRDRLAGRLRGKAAAIMGGESGLGRAVAFALAKAGADVAILYLNDHRAAEDARRAILRENVRCVLVAGDVSRGEFCHTAIKLIFGAFGRLDILVNNATELYSPPEQQELGGESRLGFRTDLRGLFRLTKAAVPHLPAGGVILNTTAVMAWHDSAHLIDDAATTATIVSFTRATARSLVARRIRVNAVTPEAMGLPIRISVRSGLRREQAPALDQVAARYVSLAAKDVPVPTGEVLHIRAAKTAA